MMGMVAHAWNSTEAEVEGSQVQDQPRIYTIPCIKNKSRMGVGGPGQRKDT